MDLLPKGIKKNWDDNNVWAQAQLIGYSQLRLQEEAEERIELYQMLGAVKK